MIISVDHGNKSIKTPNTLFTSGLISSEGLQGFKTDYICWNGRYYTLTEQRISYLRDKTEDERFYVLTLFAIAKELERRKAAETLDPIDITLLIGLPPAHYEQLHSRFEQYFLRRREAIDFEYNGKYYSIRISKVLSYPQAFAAAVTQYSTLKTYSVAYIIDIGGFTIDVLKLRNGRPDLAVVESFEKGVITLYNSITSKCNALYARILEDCDIDEVIRNQPTVLPGEVQQLIRSMTGEFLSEFYNFLRERGIDVTTSKCVFAGGGSLLLRGMIERANKVAFPIFIEDIHANAHGYELLYQSEVFSVEEPEGTSIVVGTARAGHFSWRAENGFHDFDSVLRWLQSHPDFTICDEYGTIKTAEEFKYVLDSCRIYSSS